jgi:sulfite dehydrogenase (cytochrome) subunit B
MNRGIPFLGLATFLMTSSPGLTDESSIQLKQTPGVDLVEQNCAPCHSLDYVEMNSPIQDKEGWTKTVEKMVKSFGASITEEDQRTIIDYLVANYGK